MKHFLLICTLLATASPVSPRPALGPSETPITGCYQDYAHSLSAGTHTELIRLCELLQTSSRLSLAVVTVPSLAGLSDEAYAAALAGPWEEADPMARNSVIVLVSFHDRTIRVSLFNNAREMPDSVAKKIIESDFIPYFKRGENDTGIITGVTAIVNWFLDQQTETEQRPIVTPED